MIYNLNIIPAWQLLCVDKASSFNDVVACLYSYLPTFCMSNFGTLVQIRNPTKLRFDLFKVKFVSVTTFPWSILTFNFQIFYPKGPHEMLVRVCEDIISRKSKNSTVSTNSDASKSYL